MKAAVENKRIEYFDWLRIWAVFMVVLIHVCTPYWGAVEISSFSWQVINLYEGITRWAAPVFFMISGVLFLGGSQSFQSILRKNVAHLVTVFVFWSALYIGINYAKGLYTLPQAAFEFLNGYYHMWYLHVIIGLYLAVPVFRKIAESAEAVKHFLILSLVVGFTIPYIGNLAGFWDPQWQQIINRQLSNFNISVATGYSFYFFLGYFLHNTEFTPGQKRWIYGLGAAGLLITVGMTVCFSLWKQTAVHFFYDYLTPNVAACCAAVFLFAKEHFRYGSISPRGIALVQKLSKYSFGIYLVHPLLYDILRYNLWIEPIHYPLLLSIPFFAVVLFVASAGIVFLIRRIPGLRKWIV